MKLLSYAALVGSIVFAGGCATKGNPGADQVNSMRAQNVSVSKNVTLPPQPEVFGQKQAAAALIGGVLGAALVADGEREQFKQYLTKNNIDVGALVRGELVAYLQDSRLFPSVVDEGNTPKFEIAIERYALDPTLAMSPINKPLSATLRVSIKLKNTDGHVLWEGSEYITALSKEGTAPRTLDEYYASPELVRTAFKQAAKIVIREMFKDLAKV